MSSTNIIVSNNKMFTLPKKIKHKINNITNVNLYICIFLTNDRVKNIIELENVHYCLIAEPKEILSFIEDSMYGIMQFKMNC